MSIVFEEFNKNAPKSNGNKYYVLIMVEYLDAMDGRMLKFMMTQRK